MNKKLLPFIVSLVVGSISTLANADDLNEVYQLALTKDPRVLKAAALVDADKEGIAQAQSSLYPSLSLSTSVTKNIDSGTSLTTDTDTGLKVPVQSDSESIFSQYRFTLNQEIFNMTTWQNLDQAKKTALRSGAQYVAAKQDLINRVTKVYFSILKAKDDLEFAIAEKKAIERQLEQTNQRFKVGLTAITDVHEAQSKFDNSVATVIRSENNVEIKKEELREITGQYHQSLATLNTERFATAKLEKSATDWVQLAQTNNQDLQVQTINMDIAKNNIDIAFSGHLPTLSLTANKGRTNTNAAEESNSNSDSVSRINPEPNNSKSIGLTLNVPIFSGFGTEAQVKRAQANYVAASEDRELTYRSVVRTVRTSYANVLTLISTIKAQEQALVSAESALGATEAGFEVGTRTIVDVLDSTTSLFSAKRNLSSSRYDYILAVLDLKLAAGTIADSDVNAISRGLKN